MLFGKLILLRNNVLLMDEPTNHLDMESIESLNNALEKYNGTLIFVSHDREFVSSLATRIIEIKTDGEHRRLPRQLRGIPGQPGRRIVAHRCDRTQCLAQVLPGLMAPFSLAKPLTTSKASAPPMTPTTTSSISATMPPNRPVPAASCSMP